MRPRLGRMGGDVGVSGSDGMGWWGWSRGQDIFISVWNLHRDPKHWERAEEFLPDRWESELDPNSFK